MSITSSSRAPILAYASTDSSCAISDSELLRCWCSKAELPIEILEEQVHPNSADRPLWREMTSEVAAGSVKTLIVPSLFHVAGDDVIGLAKFFAFLKSNRATLKSLTELIDTGRDSTNSVLIAFIESRKKSQLIGPTNA